MNKFFSFWLFFCTIINTGDLSSSSQLLSKSTSFVHGAKIISFWSTCAVGFETFGYFFDQIKPYEHDNKETVTWSDYWKKKSLNSVKSCYNSLLSCGQSLTGYFGAQSMTNVVRSCSFRPPHPVKFESVNLFMTYVTRHKQSNPYEKVNNVLASAAGSCCMENLFEHGMPDLDNLFYMMPVCWKFKMIRFFGGNRISLLPKMGEPFLNGMLLNFELAEYIVKGWSGKYHANNKVVISLQWFLLLTSYVALRFYLTQENEILAKRSEIKLSGSLLESYTDDSIIENKDAKPQWYKECKVAYKDDLRARFEENKNTYQEEQKKYQEEQKKYQEELLLRKLFFGNIIAFMTGIFFHAFLNASYYWYTHYHKI